MRKLGIYSTSGRGHIRLRNQMKRLFNAHVQLVYKDESGEATVNSQIADRTEFWWNPKRPDDRSLWESKIEPGREVLPGDHLRPQTPGRRADSLDNDSAFSTNRI